MLKFVLIPRRISYQNYIFNTVDIYANILYVYLRIYFFRRFFKQDQVTFLIKLGIIHLAKETL